MLSGLLLAHLNLPCKNACSTLPLDIAYLSGARAAEVKQITGPEAKLDERRQKYLKNLKCILETKIVKLEKMNEMPNSGFDIRNAHLYILRKNSIYNTDPEQYTNFQ